MIELNRIYNEDCMKGMKKIPDKTIDMILCDLPYGVTSCQWDKVIPLDNLWQEYKRIIKDNGAIVLTAAQPFTTALIHSNPRWYRYSWYWRKNIATGFANSKYQPLRCMEDITVFYKKAPAYNPQGLIKLTQPKCRAAYNRVNSVYGSTLRRSYVQEYTNYPTNLLEIKCERGLHPTQKPVELFEYLIKTYSDEGETVLDNCMGSGTTAVACMQTGRNYIGFETSKEYCQIAENRTKNAAGSCSA